MKIRKVLAGILFWAVVLTLKSMAQAQTVPKVTITWDPIDMTGITDVTLGGYIVRRSLAGVDSFVLVGKTAKDVLEITDTGINDSSDYLYKVAGFEAEGLHREGEYSEPLPFSYKQIQPAAVPNIVALPIPSTINGRAARLITWDAPTYRDGSPIDPALVPTYKLFQSLVNSTGFGTQIANQPARVFEVQGLNKNRTYYFYVKCTVKGIEGPPSIVLKVQT